MTNLKDLKLTTQIKPAQISPVLQRRNKLAKRIWEQMELVKAQQNKTEFVAKRFRTVKDSEGNRKQVEQHKRVKSWVFVADNGKLAVSVRYGAKVLELAKGKWAVEIASEREVLTTLEVIKSAVLNGELDTAIDSAAKRLKEGFIKK